MQSWRPRHRALGVEAALQARDQVGVQDFVLLERYESEAAFVDNLRKRFAGDLIYVSFFATYVALVSSRDRERQRGGNSTKHVINSYSMKISTICVSIQHRMVQATVAVWKIWTNRHHKKWSQSTAPRNLHRSLLTNVSPNVHI